MRTINFQRLEVFTNIERTQCCISDVRKELGEAIYNNGHGIAAHALALKIYNSQGSIEIDDNEGLLLEKFVQQFGTPSLIDAINTAINTPTEQHEKN